MRNSFTLYYMHIVTLSHNFFTRLLELEDGAPALQYAKPYLFIRSFAFLPSLVSLIGFSAFRGKDLFSSPVNTNYPSLPAY